MCCPVFSAFILSSYINLIHTVRVDWIFHQILIYETRFILFFMKILLKTRLRSVLLYGLLATGRPLPGQSNSAHEDLLVFDAKIVLLY